MDVLQYRDFVFPHNPASIKVTGTDQVATHFRPGQGDAVQRLGRRARRVTCSGSFFSATFRQTLAQLESLRQKAAGDQPGLLFLPGMEPFPAYLEQFVFDAKGDGKVISYTIVFVEAQAVQ